MKRLFISATIAALSLASSAQVNSPDCDGYRLRAVDMYGDNNFIGCIDQMNYLKSQSPSPDQLEDADFYIAMSNARLGKADAPALLKYFLWKYPDSPRRPVVKLNIANLLLDKGEYGEALSTYETVDIRNLDRANAHELAFNKAYCLLKLGDYDRADGIYQSLAASPRYSNSARFYEGYIAYIQKDYRRAADILRRVDTSAPPADMADYYLAQIYFIQGDYTEALATARRLLSSADLDPEFSVEISRIAGESLYHLGNDAEAIPMLRSYVTSVAEPLPSALYILGVADYRAGDYDLAIDRLTPVSSLDNAMGQSANLFIGQSFMQLRNYTSAMHAFERALRSDFDRDVQETAFYNYAVAKTEGGRIPFGSSVNTFEEFLRRFPSSRYAPGIREYIVTGYMTDNNYPAALASIEAVTNPSQNILKAKQQVLYTLGTRELASGNTSSAINHLRQARQLRNLNPQIGAETDLWLGEALYTEGNFDEAAKSYQTYLSNKSASKDNRPLALYDLAYARFQAGKYEEALTGFNRFLNEQGRSSSATVADAYNRVADCHYYNSDFSSAADAYRKAYAVNPDNGDYALFQESVMKGLTRDYKGKIDGMRSMIQRFPSSGLVPDALLEIGQSYDQLNQPDKTVESYSMVAATYPATRQGRQANLLLALTYLNNGNSAQAIDTYKDIIRTAPTSDEASQAIDNLKVLMIDNGQLSEFTEFIDKVPEAAKIQPTELDNLTFTSAEREYLNSGLTGRLTEYLEHFPNGASRPAALNYVIAAGVKSGNTDATLRYADELITVYPDNPNVPDALKAKADMQLAQGKGQLALESYTLLEQKASTPYMVNEARIGIMRTARDLALYDRVIEAADALTSSSTLSAAQRSEARFTRAYANSFSGKHEAAAAEWSELAADLNDIQGAKSAFYLANQQFELGDLASARKTINRLIDSDTPYNYWYARGVILLSDINRAEGNTYEADAYLNALRDNYPGSESDIFNMIQQRQQK